MTVIHIVMFEVYILALPDSSHAFADPFKQFKPTVEKAKIEEVHCLLRYSPGAPKH